MSSECILCGKACPASNTLTKGKWESVQVKSKLWSGLDKFGDVHERTPWDGGPAGYLMHPSCYITISSSVKLKDAQQRKKTENDSSQCLGEASDSAH